MLPDVKRSPISAFFAALLGLAALTACGVPGDPPTASLGGEDDRDGSGIGGTGIQGVITDFGSVIVNGLRVDVDAATPVRRDGEAAEAGALALGQVIAAEADGDIDSLVARSIEIRREVLGPIDHIDRAVRALTVLGQDIVLAGNVRGAGEVALGQMVAVSGLRLPDGTIVATRIEVADPDDRPHLYGVYALGDDEAAGGRVGGLAIGGLAPRPSLQGREVFVRGLLSDGVLIATELEPEPEIPFDGRLARLSIAGFVDEEGSILPKLRLARRPRDLLQIELPGGLSGLFGIFEGHWSPDGSLFDVDREIGGGDVFGALFDEERREHRQEYRDDRRDRRQDRREEQQDQRDDRDHGRDGRW